MGRSVEAGFVSSLPQNASQHRRRRSLPVRAGNEDAGKAPFRMFKSFDKHAHVLKVEFATRLLATSRPQLRSEREQALNRCLVGSRHCCSKKAVNRLAQAARYKNVLVSLTSPDDPIPRDRMRIRLPP